MKKALIAFVAIVSLVTVNAAMGAIAIKKAAPVATQTASSSSTTASLVPSVLTLVSNVQQLTAKQKELSTECMPSSAEITFVDNIVKEWAKTGSVTKDDVEKQLRRKPCSAGSGYAARVRDNAVDGVTEICYDTFVGTGNAGMVWEGFPKVGMAEYCDDGGSGCKNKKKTSDIYEIFNLVDFEQKDYTVNEATMAAKLISKIEECSDAKLSQKKRAMWGEFLTTTMGNVGQKTSTSSIMDTVGNITQSGTSLSGGLSSLGSIATQYLNK